MSWHNNIAFRIPKQTDRRIVESILDALDEAAIGVTEIDVRPLFLDNTVSISADKPKEDEQLAELLNQEGELLQTFAVGLQDGPVIRVERKDEPWDSVIINLHTFSGSADDFASTPIPKFLTTLRSKLRALDSHQGVSALLSDEVAKSYAAREATLQKLENLLVEAAANDHEHRQHVRQNYEEDFSRRSKDLDETHAERQKHLEEDYRKRKAELDERETALKEKEEAIDADDARQARRNLRKEMKKDLAGYKDNFTLTADTLSLKVPVLWTLVSLTVVFGILFVVAVVRGLLPPPETPLTTWQEVTQVVRQVVFGVGFVVSAVFFIKWQSRLFRTHAEEEFRLRRLELDIDRATWAYEMAIEWKDEKEKEMPAGLWERLTRNLFSSGSEEEEAEARHPMEELLGNLLKSSAGLKVQTPIGEAALDRKSLKDMTKG